MPYPDTDAVQGQMAGGTTRRTGDVPLILTQLSPHQVADTSPLHGQPIDVMTFGMVRELCPACQGGLKLILRQSSIRVAHLFCADCATCYDARYPDGAPALTL